MRAALLLALALGACSSPPPAVARTAAADSLTPWLDAARTEVQASLDQMVDARGNDAAAGLDHVVDQLMRIAAQRVELELCLLDHRTELVMRGDAHAMALREPAADGEEGLDVAARSDDHDDDRHARHRRRVTGRQRRIELPRVGRDPRRGVRKDLRRLVEVHVQAMHARRDQLETAHRRCAHTAIVQPAPEEGFARSVEEAALFPLVHASPNKHHAAREPASPWDRARPARSVFCVFCVRRTRRSSTIYARLNRSARASHARSALHTRGWSGRSRTAPSWPR